MWTKVNIWPVWLLCSDIHSNEVKRSLRHTCYNYVCYSRTRTLAPELYGLLFYTAYYCSHTVDIILQKYYHQFWFEVSGWKKINNTVWLISQVLEIRSTDTTLTAIVYLQSWFILKQQTALCSVESPHVLSFCKNFLDPLIPSLNRNQRKVFSVICVMSACTVCNFLYQYFCFIRNCMRFFYRIHKWN